MKSYIQGQNLKFLPNSFFVLVIGIAVLMLNGCSFRTRTVDAGGMDSPQIYKATMKPYTVAGKTYYPTMVSTGNTFSGTASWYGMDFHGRKTSNGEIYDMYKTTAAHKTFPMNTIVKVTSIKNGKSVIVRINDRGPFVQNRIIDLSYAAALAIDMTGSGTAPVKLEVLGFEGNVEMYAKNTAHVKQSVIISDFDVQIGAFRKNSGAKIYQTMYNDKKSPYKAIIQEGLLERDVIYRVWIQGFRSEEEARDFISRSEYEGAFIVREK
jgi:rare lipoprotein A